MRLSATRHATSLQTPPAPPNRQRYRHGGHAVEKGGGRGNLRVAKTPPLQSGVCGDIVAIQIPAIAASMRIPCHTRRRAVLKRRGTIYRNAAHHVATNARHHMRIPCNPVGLPPVGIYCLYHDAARRVATVFEKWDCAIKNSLRTRRLNPYGPFAAVPLLEYGGLNPILPVLRRT